MASHKIAYGTRTAFSQEDNLTSLANSAAKPLGEVDNSSTLALDYTVYLKIQLAAASVSATGSIEVYLLEKDDATADSWTDGIDGDSTSDSVSSLKNARLLEVLVANANNQVVIWQGRIADYVSTPPKYWTLLIYNRTGAAFTGTDGNHDAFYTAITGTIA